MRRVVTLDISPDGKRVVTGSDRYVQVWDRSLKNRISIMSGHTNPITCVLYSPDGKSIASGSEDSTVRIWDAETGDCTACLRHDGGYITRVLYTPDGKSLVTCAAAVRLWDLKTQGCVKKFPTEGFFKYNFDISPNGLQLARNETENDVHIRDIATGDVKGVLKGHIECIMSLVYSPDGKYIATGSGNHELRIWDTETYECKSVLLGHTNWVRRIIWSSSATYVISACIDMVIVWDLSTFECVSCIHIQVSSLISPNLFWYKKNDQVYIEEIPFLSFYDILLGIRKNNRLSDPRIYRNIVRFL